MCITASASGAVTSGSLALSLRLSRQNLKSLALRLQVAPTAATHWHCQWQSLVRTTRSLETVQAQAIPGPVPVFSESTTLAKQKKF